MNSNFNNTLKNLKNTNSPSPKPSSPKPSSVQTTPNRGTWSNPTIIYDGKEYSIYVPAYTNGTNALNSNGWSTVNTIEKKFTSTSWPNVAAEFVGNFGNNSLSIPAEGSFNEINQNVITYKNASDKGTLVLNESNGKITNGVGTLIELLYGSVNAYYNNTNTWCYVKKKYKLK